MGFYITQPQDEVRRQLFQASVVLHSDDLDQAYATQRARVQRLIMAAAGDSFGARWWPGYWVLQFISWSCTDRTQLLWQAITGNRTAWARLIAKLRRVITGAKP